MMQNFANFQLKDYEPRKDSTIGLYKQFSDGIKHRDRKDQLETILSDKTAAEEEEDDSQPDRSKGPFQIN